MGVGRHVSLAHPHPNPPPRKGRENSVGSHFAMCRYRPEGEGEFARDEHLWNSPRMGVTSQKTLAPHPGPPPRRGEGEFCWQFILHV